MSNDPLIHISMDVAAMLSDRVVTAAGEDAATGSTKLDALIDRIAIGQEPMLSVQEKESLEAARAGAFKRGRGQYKSDRRLEQRARRYELKLWLKRLREYLKHDPDEQAYKREQRKLRANYTLRNRAHHQGAQAAAPAPGGTASARSGLC